MVGAVGSLLRGSGFDSCDSQSLLHINLSLIKVWNDAPVWVDA